MENGKRPYVPMALTLFPTKICLKFASVPVPEAHKYVIPPISYFARSPFRSTPSLSRRHPPPPPPSPTHGDSRTTPYVFLRGCSSSRQYKGKHGKSFVPKENTMQYPGRDATACVSPPLLSSPFFSFSPIRFRPELFSQSLTKFSSLSLFRGGGGREGGRIARAISQPPYCIGKNGLKWQTHALL